MSLWNCSKFNSIQPILLNVNAFTKQNNETKKQSGFFPWYSWKTARCIELFSRSNVDRARARSLSIEIHFAFQFRQAQYPKENANRFAEKFSSRPSPENVESLTVSATLLSLCSSSMFLRCRTLRTLHFHRIDRNWKSSTLAGFPTQTGQIDCTASLSVSVFRFIYLLKWSW